MRLIDAKHMISAGELRLVNRTEPHRQPYAILSHTWGRQTPNGSWDHDEDEILFADVGAGGTRDQKSPGWEKIWQACKRALDNDLDYVWVDTCCINKDSSAELDESINAMFTWYEQSAVCLAYLADLCGPLDSRPGKQEEQLQGCRWMRRGWTLQEMIAPKRLIFYDRDWNQIGSRSDLAGALQSITGVDGEALLGTKPCSSFTVARKMNWAANRETKRPEDRAYSLLGIFGVSMTLLYGLGGETAFRRLQEEIVRTTIDMTIFAWNPCNKTNQFGSMFADSPDQFESSGHTKSMILDAHFSITNRGVLLSSSTLRVAPDELRGPAPPLVLLVGYVIRGDIVECIGIYLRKIGSAIYVRDGTQGVARFSEKIGNYKLKPVPRHQCYITLSPHDLEVTLRSSLRRLIRVPSDLSPNGLGSGCSAKVLHHVPESTWDYENCWFLHVGYGHKDVVTATYMTMEIHGHILEFAVMFSRWEGRNQPRTYILDVTKKWSSVSSIFSPMQRFNSARWGDLMIDPSEQKSYSDVTAQGRSYRISTSLVNEAVEFRDGVIDTLTLRLDVQPLSQLPDVPDSGEPASGNDGSTTDIDSDPSMILMKRHRDAAEYEQKYNSKLSADDAQRRVRELEQQLKNMQQQVQDLSRSLGMDRSLGTKI